jgi:hypothetical protein
MLMGRQSDKPACFGRTAFGRRLSMLIVAIFLISNVAHAFACDTSRLASAQTAISAIADTNSEIPSKVEVDAIHCHGCAAVHLPVIENAARNDSSASETLGTPQSGLVVAQRPSDPPPPRS